MVAKKIPRAPGAKKKSKKKKAKAKVPAPRDDTPFQVLRDIESGVLDARDLNANQRRATLMVQLSNGVARTTAKFAEFYGVSVETIRSDLSRIRKEIGREVDKEWTAENVLGSLIMTKERCQHMASATGDAALIWAIERDTVKLLKELGVVGVKDPQQGLRVTVEALGEGYERARESLTRAISPILTGRRVEQDEDCIALPPPRSLPVEDETVPTPKE